MNRACFPKEKHQNSHKMGEIHELFFLALSLIVLVFLRKNTRIHKEWAKFMNFSFGPFVWFGLPGRLLT